VQLKAKKMQQEFNRFLKENKLYTADEVWLLGMSGGVDSMVLGNLLLNAKIPIEVAHCNFQLRGDESSADEKFVESWCETHGIAFNVKRFDLSNAKNIQKAARDSRYEWFAELMATKDLNKLATAHHASDNVETLFINLLRGAGNRGWAGIPLSDNWVVRPLLFATKTLIETFATEEQIAFREDSSNLENKYLRNKIRHHLMPVLREIDAEFETKISQNQLRLQSSNKLLSDLILQTNADVIENLENGEVKIHYRNLNPANQTALVLFEILREYDFDWNQTQDILAVEQSGALFNSYTHQLLVDRDFLLIRHVDQPDIPESITLIEESQTVLNTPISLSCSKSKLSEVKFSNDSNLAIIDFDKLTFPLQVRRWQQGDQFVPLGMKGSKKLSDFFIDQKLNNFQKESVYVLESANEIVWVVGHRISDVFKITPKTRNAYILQVQ
jgi:tRNA(Ile)-lysidine synthase